MVNTIFILDKNKETSKILSINKHSQNIFWDDVYHQELATGAESFEFSCYSDMRVVEGANVAFYYNQQYKMFTIMEVEEEHSEGQIISHCYCETSSMELINQYVRAFSGDMSCLQFFLYILDNTGWQIGKYNSSLENKIATVKVDKAQSIWSLIEDYKDIFECEINVRVIYENGKITNQLIDVYAEGEMGTPTYKRFEYGRNVVGITKSKDLYDWATGLIVDVEGVNDITFSRAKGDPFDKEVGDVILDHTNNEIYNAGRGYIMGVYQGDEKDPRTACLDAWKELQKRAVPKFDYEVTTAITSEEYESLHLGDTVYVIDYGYTPALLLEARVGELELSFTDRTQNKCTLTNYKEVKSRLLGADYIKLTGTITDVVNAFFPIGADGIADGAIVDGKIDTVYYEEITADIVSAGIGVFEDMYVKGLTVVNADIQNLNAEVAQIAELKAQVAEIDTLVNGHLTSDNIQSLILTSDKVTVADAFIKNAMIDSINASKITSGFIDTSRVNIQSSDASMVITGSTQQFKDKNGRVRIQIGKDSQGNFTFSLFDESGTGILINEKGITENAIADGLIVNDMVSDDANISGSKLDINSVITEVNNSTSTIKGSKIKLDEANQTLDVAFNSLTTTVGNINSSGSNLIRNSSALQGASHWTLSAPNETTLVAEKTGDRSMTQTVAKCSMRISSTSTVERFFFSKRFRLKKNTTYTFSVKYLLLNGGKGIDFYVLTSSTVPNDNSYESAIDLGRITTVGSDFATFTKTFTTSDNVSSAILRIDHNGTNTSGSPVYYYIADIMLEEGSVASIWSPALEDSEERITSNTTSISTQQGQISTLISNTTITKSDGTVVQLKDDYNSTKSTVSSNTTKIGSLTTTVNSVSSKQSTLEQDVNGFKTTVTNNYVSKTDANNTYATKSSLSQTATDLTATFNKGYNQGIVNMSSNGITVTHSGTSRYTNMDANGFTTYHSDGYSTFSADGLFRYVRNPNDMNLQTFRYKTVSTQGTIAFEARSNAQISVTLPGTFDHLPSSEISVIFTFNGTVDEDASMVISYYDVPARAHASGWYKNSSGHWQHDELYCTLLMYDTYSEDITYAEGYVVYFAYA